MFQVRLQYQDPRDHTAAGNEALALSLMPKSKTILRLLPECI
jgi:hypothetical protein